MAIVNAKYTSVWDCGTEITTPCKFNTEDKIVFDVEDSDVEIDSSLEEEYVTLSDGKVLKEEEDGVEFEY